MKCLNILSDVVLCKLNLKLVQKGSKLPCRLKGRWWKTCQWLVVYCESTPVFSTSELADMYRTLKMVLIRNCFSHFYPTALKGCRGIVFTHGVRMGGPVGGRA